MVQAYNHGSVFLGTSPYPEAIQKPIRSHFISIKVAPITQEIPRDLGILCQELESKTRY